MPGARETSDFVSASTRPCTLLDAGGAMLFGLIYAFLAIAHPQLLFGSAYLLATGLALLLGYVALGKWYWFRVPFTGISVALVCYVASVLVSLR